MAWKPLLIGAVSFVLVMALMFGFIHFVGLERLQQIINDAGSLAPLAYIALRAATYVAAPLSSGPVQFTSGILFGLWQGTLYSIIGEVIGGSINFWIARLLGRPAVRRLAGTEGLARIDDFYNRAGEWRTLAVMRVVLFSFYDFISYAVGFTPLQFRTYVIVSFFAGLPPTFAAVALGASFTGDIRVIILVIVVGVALSAFALLNKRARQMLGLERRQTAEDSAGRGQG
jgi:uncharacterized membrane protein YdjX (TVP38/TMEM64 family)